MPNDLLNILQPTTIDTKCLLSFISAKAIFNICIKVKNRRDLKPNENLAMYTAYHRVE